MPSSKSWIDACYRPRPRFWLALGLLLLTLSAAAGGLGWPWPTTLRGTLAGAGIGCLFGALLQRQLPDPLTATTPALRRRYLREFLPPMAAYVVLVLAAAMLLRHVDATWLRAPIAVMPLPAVALAMRAFVRHVRDTDELQRRIELEAVSVATLLVSMLYLGGGFLQSAKVIDVPAAAAMIWVFPLVCVSYGLAKVYVGRRYQ